MSGIAEVSIRPLHTRRLIDRFDDDELAAAMAHEIGQLLHCRKLRPVHPINRPDSNLEIERCADFIGAQLRSVIVSTRDVISLRGAGCIRYDSHVRCAIAAGGDAAVDRMTPVISDRDFTLGGIFDRTGFGQPISCNSKRGLVGQPFGLAIWR